MTRLTQVLVSLLLALSEANARLATLSSRGAGRVWRSGGSSDVDVVTFTLYDNGASTGGVDVTLTRREFPQSENGLKANEEFAVEMSKKIKVSKFQSWNVVAHKAFREDGEQVTSFEHLVPEREDGDNRRVYLVAGDLEFVWPFIEVGHNQTVSPNVVPPVLPDGSPIVLESLSETPRVFRIYNLFTHDEADSLIDTALTKKGPGSLKRSTVGNAKRGEKEDGSQNAAHADFGRTSDNAWDHSSPVAKRVISRSFQLTRMEEDVGKIDGLQIVRYKPGQGYNTHPDYFGTGRGTEDQDFDFNPYSGGSNRFATVFMYLNDVEEGGSTCFPRVPGLVPREQAKPPSEYALEMFKPNTWEKRLTMECSHQLAVPPVRGTAALFYSSKPDGRIDPMSHHGACPVIRGTKWGANVWLWNKQRYGDIKTGEKRALQIVNSASETVYLTWEGRANGVLRPGQTISIGTFQFHRFKAHYGYHKNKPFTTFTVQVDPQSQTWVIEDSLEHLEDWRLDPAYVPSGGGLRRGSDEPRELSEEEMKEFVDEDADETDGEEDVSEEDLQEGEEL